MVKQLNESQKEIGCKYKAIDNFIMSLNPYKYIAV